MIVLIMDINRSLQIIRLQRLFLYTDACNFLSAEFFRVCIDLIFTGHKVRQRYIQSVMKPDRQPFTPVNFNHYNMYRKNPLLR